MYTPRLGLFFFFFFFFFFFLECLEFLKTGVKDSPLRIIKCTQETAGDTMLPMNELQAETERTIRMRIKECKSR